MKIDIEKEFPKLYSLLDKDDFIDELRYFVVVDENYQDFDDEENDVFDPNDYNYLIYITERTANAIGKDNLEKLYKTLEESGKFENFLASEEDLYGVKTELTEDKIALEILKTVEKILEEQRV